MWLWAPCTSFLQWACPSDLSTPLLDIPGPCIVSNHHPHWSSFMHLLLTITAFPTPSLSHNATVPGLCWGLQATEPAAFPSPISTPLSSLSNTLHHCPHSIAPSLIYWLLHCGGALLWETHDPGEILLSTSSILTLWSWFGIGKSQLALPDFEPVVGLFCSRPFKFPTRQSIFLNIPTSFLFF